jgi:hypothetical protein
MEIQRKFLTLKVSGFGYMGKQPVIGASGKYADFSVSSSYGTDDTNWTRVRLVGADLVTWFTGKCEETGFNFVHLDNCGLETESWQDDDKQWHNATRLICYSKAQIRLLATEKALLRRHGVEEPAKPAAKAPARPAAKPAAKAPAKAAAKAAPRRPAAASVAGDWD